MIIIPTNPAGSKLPSATVSHMQIGAAYTGNNNETDLRQIAVSPDGSIAYVTDYQDQYGGVNGGRFHKVNLAAMTSTKYDYANGTSVAGALGPIKFNNDGTKVLMYGAFTTFTIVNTATNAYSTANTGNGSNYGGVQGFGYRPGTPSGGWLAYSSGVVNFSEAGTAASGFGFPNPVGMTGGATDVGFSPDGLKAYCVARGEGSIKVINAAGGFMYNPGTINIPISGPPWSPTFQQGYVEYPNKIVMSPTLSKAYILTDYSLQVLDTTTNTITKALWKYRDAQAATSSNYGVNGGFTSIAVNPLGTKVYATVLDNQVCVFDTATETWENDILIYPAEGRESYATRPSSVAVSPDSSKLYVVNRLKNTVSVIA